jgi:hypothetical protein
MERGSIILTAVVAGAISGVVGNLATGYLRASPAKAKPAPAVTAQAEEAPDLAARVTELEAEVARLRQRRNVGAPMPTPAGTQRPAEGGQRALPDDPVFEAAVRDVMNKMQEERAGEREDRRQQGVQRWADQLGEKLQLNDQQKASVAAIGQDFVQKLRDQREAGAGTPAGQPMFEQRSALLAQAEQKLAEVLSPKQMQTYKESPDLQLIATLRGGAGGGRWRRGE